MLGLVKKFHAFALVKNSSSELSLREANRIKKWPIVPGQLFQTKVLSNW